MIRGLIDAIVLTPEKGQLRIELRGNLAAMLTAAQKTSRSPETGDLLVPVLLVAGARNQRFRLLCTWSPRDLFSWRTSHQNITKALYILQFTDTICMSYQERDAFQVDFARQPWSIPDTKDAKTVGLWVVRACLKIRRAAKGTSALDLWCLVITQRCRPPHSCLLAERSGPLSSQSPTLRTRLDGSQAVRPRESVRHALERRSLGRRTCFER